MKLKDINYSVALLCVLSGRAVILGCSVGDALAIAALCALCGFRYYTESKKEAPINDTVKNELEQIRSTLNGLKMARSIQRN
jgi:hypothetical protein